MNKKIAGVTLWLALHRTTDAVKAHSLAHLARRTIGPTDFGLLEALLHIDEQPVNELGRKVLISSGSITTAVDRMEKRGFVKRKNSATDRRLRVVCLTASGRAFIEPLFAEHAEAMEQGLRALDHSERRHLFSLLTKLRKGALS